MLDSSRFPSANLKFVQPEQWNRPDQFPWRALLTILKPAVDELAEPALAGDWLRPEEDAARAQLQPDR